MVWPPTTHQHVEDEIDLLRGAGLVRNGVATGLYYSGGGAVGTLSMTAGTVAFQPLWIPTCTLDRLACSVSTAATAASGGLMRVGLYATGSDGLPGGLLVDGGTASSETTGLKQFTISLAVQAGLYWGAVGCQVAAATVRGATDHAPGFGLVTPGGANIGSGFQGAAAGAFPDPAPSLTAANAVARCWYRRSA